MFRLFFLVFILSPLLTFGQTESQKTLAKFIITDAKSNGQDITPILLEAEAYTVFYTSGDDGLVYMANVWPKNNSQSFGPMYGVQAENIEETYENYEADFFYFNWQYKNTYDGKTGTAKVQVVKVYKPQGVTFTLKIIPEDLDVIVYKGFMEGTVDFGVFSNTKEEESNAERFRVDYNHVSIFDMETENWGDWQEGDNTFVINYNDNGDIAHYLANGDFVLYKKISGVEEDYTDSGEPYQVVTALDENGYRFRFQIFNDPKIGLKLIYSDVMIQFARF
jgi:hypothetical protein